MAPDDERAATAATSSAIDGVCGSEPKQLPVGNSVRILSFNTELLSPWFYLPDIVQTDSTHNRGAAIAAIIREGKFDVVGLNEVWDENDGKDQLVDKLCPTYPNFVKSVDADTLSDELPEDSGLMVFSKLPFVPLPNTTFVSGDSESSLGDNSNRIAFTKFTTCAGEDCLASKGALMVRLLMASQRTLNFVTTHLQADDGNETIRTRQMRQIRGRCESGAVSSANLITTTLGMSLNPNAGLCAWDNTQWLAFAGDHNIHGEGAVRANVHPGTAVPVTGEAEWETKTGVPSDGVATNGWSLYDAWAETTSPLDVGFSHINDSRYDFIMPTRRTAPPPVAGPPPPDLCVQYVWNPPELVGLSDHKPVAADFNLTAPQCNPRLAYTLLPTDLNIANQVKAAKTLPRTLTFPGSMQWFRITTPGTYTFAVTGASLAFEVFTDDNLSVPLGGSQNLGPDVIKSCPAGTTGNCATITGTKFVMSTPGFVRVFSTSRAFAGSYTFTAYKYTCKSPVEACSTLPHSPTPFQFPSGGVPLNPNDDAWFSVIIAEQADSGAAQSIRFHADHTGAGAWTTPTFQVFNAAGTLPLATIDGMPISGQLAMTNPAGKQRAFRTASATMNQTVLLRVKRNNVAQALAFDVGWQTNLMLVGALAPSGATLICKDETNPEVGSDEIRMRIRVDGVWRDGGFGEFDCNNNEDPKPWSGHIGVVRALNEVLIRVIEEDDFLAGGDDLSGAAPVDMLPLESRISGAGAHSIHWTFEDGEYRFDFQGGKWRE